MLKFLVLKLIFNLREYGWYWLINQIEPFFDYDPKFFTLIFSKNTNVQSVKILIFSKLEFS